MVGEFPELQGLMGGYYAAKQGLAPQVAAAIRDHYKPVGQGDDVPTDPVTVAVSLADKLDTLYSFFAVELFPTGSKDPFALRRAMLGIIATILQSNIRFPFTRIARRHYAMEDGSLAWFLDFLDDRLKVQQREAGVRHDLIDAVFALGGEDDLVRLLARVHALQGFVETGEGGNLLAGYKRAANILKKEGRGDASVPVHTPETGGGIAQTGEEDPLALVEDPGVAQAVAEMAQPGSGMAYEPEPEEAALIEALDKAEPLAAIAIQGEDFEGAMAALAALRAPIDAFFESVTVNDADPAKREARLGLLARFRSAVHRVADFSKIEG
jgi:glycyl-tRNA synthetase beta chain